VFVEDREKAGAVFNMQTVLIHIINACHAMGKAIDLTRLVVELDG
jgi:hypothetical protein